jgi:hypothetical protein
MKVFFRSGNENDGENEAHFHRNSENVTEKLDDLDNDAVNLLDGRLLPTKFLTR